MKAAGTTAAAPRATMRKSSTAALASFEAAIADFPKVQLRKMFGYPSAFVGGNMAAGLYEEDLFVRLPAETRDRVPAMDRARPLEPMPGRPMKGYVVLPPDVAMAPEARRAWLAAAITATAKLPPKGKPPAAKKAKAKA